MILIPASQAHGLGKALLSCTTDGAEIEILAIADIPDLALDLPEGTIEVRQGDSFCAIDLDGKAVEST